MRLRQPRPRLIVGGKRDDPSSLLTTSSLDSALQPAVSLKVDNIEVVILLRGEGALVCNLPFLLETTRLKTLSRLRDILCPKPQRGWRFPFRMSMVPTCPPRFPFILVLNRFPPLPPCCAFYSREDDTEWPESPCLSPLPTGSVPLRTLLER